GRRQCHGGRVAADLGAGDSPQLGIDVREQGVGGVRVAGTETVEDGGEIGHQGPLPSMRASASRQLAGSTHVGSDRGALACVRLALAASRWPFFHWAIARNNRSYP